MRRFLWLLVLLGCAQTGLPAVAQQVSMQVSGLQAEYRPGDSGQVGFFLQLPGPDQDAPEQGVWFLNIVKPLEGGDVQQVSQLLFAAASEDPVVFRRVFSTAELEAGVEGGLTFRFRNNAPAGTYNLVLQLFDGSITNPGRVKAGQRLAIKAWPFTIVP